MKYLKEFSELEDDVMTILKDCFTGVSDIIDTQEHSGVRFKNFNSKSYKKYYGKNNEHVKTGRYEVTILFEFSDFNVPYEDYVADSGRDDIHLDKTYRPSSFNMEILDEIKNSISLSTGFAELEIKSIGVEYFDIPKSDGFLRLVINTFNPDSEFFKLLEDKGDKIRWIKIFYDIN